VRKAEKETVDRQWGSEGGGVLPGDAAWTFLLASDLAGPRGLVEDHNSHRGVVTVASAYAHDHESMIFWPSK
jgi:hypothetical protein